jgi:hypothetical protein
MSVAHSGPEWDSEIQRRRSILPQNLLHDPDFAVISPLWDNYHHDT